MIQLLNEDLEGEHQAIIAYILHSQVLEGAAYTDIARELESQAREKPGHARVIAKLIDYSGGMPSEEPNSFKTSNDPVEMLRAAFENERETVWRYRERVCQAEAMEEFASSENLRAIIAHEQVHVRIFLLVRLYHFGSPVGRIVVHHKDIHVDIL